MINIVSIIGTRPEAIKMALLAKKLDDHTQVNHRLVLTGQHTDMVDSVIELFQCRVHENFNVMQKANNLSSLFGLIYDLSTEYLDKDMPDLVLVHGDTASCAASALAAFNMQIPVGHVEAGLRTFNLNSPFPEEGYRQIVDSVSTYCFAPTGRNVRNITKNSQTKVWKTGNTVIDSLLFIADKSDLKEADKNTILITGHRRENLDIGIDNLVSALVKLANEYPENQFVWPIHPNPIIKQKVKILDNFENVKILPAMDYFNFVSLLAKSKLVITDSGGIQEEAPAFGIPVIVTRDTTERPEAVESGNVIVIGNDELVLVESVKELLTNEDIYNRMSKAVNPYGTGNATDQIISYILNEFHTDTRSV